MTEPNNDLPGSSVLSAALSSLFVALRCVAYRLSDIFAIPIDIRRFGVGSNPEGTIDGGVTNVDPSRTM